MSVFPLEGRDSNLVISVAQFRPEKRHDLQLAALAASNNKHFNLVCIGSVRNADDTARADALERSARDMGRP